eukprot:g4191.t1
MLTRISSRLRPRNLSFNRELIPRHLINEFRKALTDDSIGASDTFSKSQILNLGFLLSYLAVSKVQNTKKKKTTTKKYYRYGRRPAVFNDESYTEQPQASTETSTPQTASSEPVKNGNTNGATDLSTALNDTMHTKPTLETKLQSDSVQQKCSSSMASTDEGQDFMKDVYTVDSVETAKAALRKLEEFLERSSDDQIFACDTEVADIDILQDSPCGHGRVTCFSVYAGEHLNFRPSNSTGPPLTHLWVDTFLSEDNADSEARAIIEVFRAFFANERFQKVWHNYGFDRHVLKNMDIDCIGFGGDTMHMARLWNSSRKGKGYSLESLSQAKELNLSDESKKTSMKEMFGKPIKKKDGTFGKTLHVKPITEIQMEEETRAKWIHYSTRDAKATYDLYQCLKRRLKNEVDSTCVMDSSLQHCYPDIKTLWDFYDQIWKPFGELLTDMEQAGFYVDVNHLAEAQIKAEADKTEACKQFRDWAKEKVPAAEFMNIASDAQIRTLLFAGLKVRKSKKQVEFERSIKIRTKEEAETTELGKKKKTKIKWVEKKVHGLWGEGQCSPLSPEILTAAGWPAVSAAALKSLVGKTGVAQKLLKDLGDEIQTPNLSDLPIEDEIENGALPPNKTEKAFLRHLDASQYGLGQIYASFPDHRDGLRACVAIEALIESGAIDALLNSFILPLQEDKVKGKDNRIHGSMNINTETGRLSCRRPNLQNQPALEKDRYQIRKAFQADTSQGHTLIVADYGQLELRILAHLTNCKSMLKAFEIGGDFHSRTAVGMYDHIQEAIRNHEVALEEGLGETDTPLVKDVYAIERRKAKTLNFSIAYGKTAHGLSKDWQVDLKDAKMTLERWYSDRKEVKDWQERTISEGRKLGYVRTLLGRRRNLLELNSKAPHLRAHAERAAINTPIQGSAADIVTAAMLAIKANQTLKLLGWKLLSQVHDEVILEGPRDSAEQAKDLVVACMSRPFLKDGLSCNPLRVELSVDAKCADNWYDAK